MPELTLIYFNIRGRAELARWIMAYGSIPYTDDRIEKDDWPARKKDIFTGKVPVLMVDGKPLPQSLAIARYLARMADLVPEDSLDVAMCDAVADSINDMMSEVYKVFLSSEEDFKKEYDDKLYPQVIKPFLARLNTRLEEKAWLISEKMTWADLFTSLAFSGLKSKRAEILDDFPRVKALMEKVLALPKIKEWNDKQPPMEM